MMHSKKFFATFAGLSALVAVPAQADTTSYVVQAYDSVSIELRACSPAVALQVYGDGDTDLDFRIYNPGGEVIHEDLDETDITFATIETGIYEGEDICRTYRLEVENLGEVYNEFEVTLEDVS